MIHQFAELGQFYLDREGVKDPLLRYAHDPSAKFRTKEILLLVFSCDGFERVQVDEYDESRRLRCLYRTGPPNGWDATATTGMATVKKGKENTADGEIAKKLTRLARSINEALERGEDIPAWESEALALMRDTLQPPEDQEGSTGADPRSLIFASLREAHGDLTEPAILTVAWRSPDKDLRWVGDFKAFQQALARKGTEAASKKKGIEGDVKGLGQCCICGKRDTEVSGLLQIQQFKIYTLDKPGSVSGGFNPVEAWRNFPACRECCDKVDFSGERIKRDLSFNYYGFKYLMLPSPVRLAPTEAHHLLHRLVSARVDHKASKRLTDAEDELFEIIADENNRLQLDLLFYQPDPQSFRPALYVSGLLPSRFRDLFRAQERTDRHPWLRSPSPRSFTEGTFTFGCFRNIYPAARGGSTFDDDFLAATRAALEIRPHRADRMLEIGMRWVQEDCLEGKAWPFRLADLFRSLQFFEELTRGENERSQPTMIVDYGDTEQADRVRRLFQQAPETSRLRADPAAQAAFLVGACCGRIETIQSLVRGSTPFEGKYKGFRLNQPDVQRLFIAAKDKAKAYGPDKERIVSGLLSCAASALAATAERWALGPDEISYYFALGHALRSRLAKEQEDQEVSPAAREEHNP
jgi:CRISPR-associated protein Csh1